MKNVNVTYQWKLKLKSSELQISTVWPTGFVLLNFRTKYSSYIAYYDV